MNYAENQLSNLLKSIGLQVRKSYNIAEVCSILGISRRTFHRLIAKADQDGTQGLESVIRNNERRVSFSELAAYMERNNTFLARHLR
ncbi:MAG: helix-turn-helix domain-containing protein [Desulfosalsimonadaceae bacterium]